MAARGNGGRRAGQCRARRPRREKRAVLLVTNGAVTEKMYLEGLARRANDQSRQITVKTRFLDGAPTTLIKELRGPRSDLSAFDEVWVVVDHDGDDRTGFLSECKHLSTQRIEVHGVISVPCFEVWLNAHYTPVRNYQDQADAQRHYAALTGQRHGAKGIPDNFPWDAMGEAVDRCRLAGTPLPGLDTQGPQPSTTMPYLLYSLRLIDSVDRHGRATA